MKCQYSATKILMTVLLAASTMALAESAPLSCAAELDAAVVLASNPDLDVDILNARFAALESTCPAFAQLTHNRGVLAAMDNRWPQAIAHFERALSKDARAADTHAHLSQIFEYRAAQAYAKALDTPLNAKPPILRFQNSSLRNSDSAQDFPDQNQLRDIATIEYELFAWWQAHKNPSGISKHYVQGYDIDAIDHARKKRKARQWQDIKREIAFTTNDVVVVIDGGTEPQTLLLMRLVGNRWKIYQETLL